MIACEAFNSLRGGFFVICFAYLETQCAAVKTALPLISEPPHWKTSLLPGFLIKRTTIHGNSAKYAVPGAGVAEMYKCNRPDVKLKEYAAIM